MKLNFIFPGKTREAFLAEGIAHYLKKLRPLADVRETVFKAAAGPPGDGPAAEALARSRESAQILERCGAGEYLVALDIQGEMMDSPALAARFSQLMANGIRVVNLAVGGPWGLDQSLTGRADLRLSLGPMTYTHELARLIILEQVYRAFTIINHLPYHK